MKYMNFFDIKLTSESIIHILIRARFQYCIYYYDLMYIIVLLVIIDGIIIYINIIIIYCSSMLPVYQVLL